MIRGVLFDFSGTLFRIESTAEWLDTCTRAAGLDLPDGERADLVRRLDRFGALPGGPGPREVPEAIEPLWAARDLTSDEHRAAYTALARAAELPVGLSADALYDRHRSPAAWQPYRDAGPTLRELRRRGLPIAVLSNIGWDLRPVFVSHGLDGLVDDYLLSFELGVRKPDPAIFQAACDRLGLAPADVLMVGDQPADAAATAIGCRHFPVDDLPVTERPAGLMPVLELVG
ncbi:HAD-IA family hydrolase [Kitasatospora sp. RB6PN24]|uniref:HAD family hydrolase n=1 Tax=Kitasatospora humi TaxID=2893891 RepID=UPI001E53C936|nr:HAD-IA family hydrolase [Kitasatospora humi]MCC9310025.1 HAD-IA family hydrolase [Kitasatospora humi]